MNIKLKSLILGSLLGIIIFNVAVYSIGFTAAITLSPSIANWATDNSVVIPMLFVWDLLIVQLLGIGILAALATYLLLKIIPLTRSYMAAGFVIAETIVSYAWLFNPVYHQHLSQNSYILFFPHFIVVCVCVFIAARLAGKAQTIISPLRS